MHIRRLFFTLLLLQGAVALHATHIVGGEITYRCLGDDRYEITLTVYRDCYNGQPPFDNPASIGVFNKDWALVKNVLVNFVKDDTIPIILTNPCLVVPPDVCVHRSSYQVVLELPYTPGGYTLTYQRCCRNFLIRNIPMPLETGASYIAQIGDTSLVQCNSSAVFNNWPPVAICVNEPIDFDHSATDPDGDSLAYRLCTPLDGATFNDPMPQPPYTGPYQEITWLDPPYNLGNLLGGDPLTIDSLTGFMTGVPNTIGNFVVGVCVDEYRDGDLISTTRRDFQYNVSDCGKPFAAFFAPEVVCNSLTVNFENNSIAANDFRWFFDYGNNPFLTSFIAEPSFTFPDTGTYLIALIAQPGDPCADTTFQEIRLTNAFVSAGLDFQYPACPGDTLLVQAIDQSADSVYGITGWQWTLNGPNGSIQESQQQNPVFPITAPGTYILTLTAEAGNGCTQTEIQTFQAPYPDLSSLADTLLICPGDTVALFPGANPQYTYQWSPGSNLITATSPNPLAFPAQSTTYAVTMSGNGGPCELSGTVTVQVQAPGQLTVTASPEKINRGETAQLLATLPGAVSYTWLPAAGLSDPNIANPVASPDTSTTYTVIARYASGCEVRGTVRITVFAPECEDPYIFLPTGFSPNGDGENETLQLKGVLIESAYWVVYNRWGEKVFEANSPDDAWDGTYKGEAQPAETYGYYLRVKCVGGKEFQKQGNITLIR